MPMTYGKTSVKPYRGGVLQRGHQLMRRHERHQTPRVRCEGLEALAPRAGLRRQEPDKCEDIGGEPRGDQCGGGRARPRVRVSMRASTRADIEA